MLRTTNGIEFLNAEDNIMHLGALTETHSSKLEVSSWKQPRNIQYSLCQKLTVSCGSMNEVDAILGCLRKDNCIEESLMQPHLRYHIWF